MDAGSPEATMAKPVFILTVCCSLLAPLLSSTSVAAGFYHFPNVTSTVVPDPAKFFAPRLLSSPLPTNGFFQNLVIGEGNMTEYIHPYLIQASSSSLSISYPRILTNSTLVRQLFVPDLTVSSLTSSNIHGPGSRHQVSAFSDLGFTLDLPSSNLSFFLVMGSPFITCNVTAANLSLSTVHHIVGLYPLSSKKHRLDLNNSKSWLIYTSAPIVFSNQNGSHITSRPFSGVLRVAVLPKKGKGYEAILDQHSGCYPISGRAIFDKPFQVHYEWETEGEGELLLLAHVLHRKMLRETDVLDGFKYTSVDGDLVGVLGKSWLLKVSPFNLSWYSDEGIDERYHPSIKSAIRNDTGELDPAKVNVTSSYYYGKMVARAARLALIAEEVGCKEAIQDVTRFLKKTVGQWVDGKYAGNGFLYESKWKGLVTRLGSNDSTQDFGFGLYNDHHYHLGYFLYAIAVLAKVDSRWGAKYKPKAYSLLADYMNLRETPLADPSYPRLRCFDLWRLHSWASGLFPFADGRDQESTSEAVNAYYAAALIGLAYEDEQLINLGSTLTAMEIASAKTWWHIGKKDGIYGTKFSEKNRITGVVWSNKRDIALWFAPPQWKACRLGIQVLPISPITKVLFSDIDYARDLVMWANHSLKLVGEGWKDFVYALEALYNPDKVALKIKNMRTHDDGNSLSNLWWWVSSLLHQ